MRAALKGSTAASPVEIWFQDEARVGQKGGHAYVWAERGTRPLMVRDNRHDSAYIFGAICPARGVGAAIITPAANTEMMNLHLAEISTQVAHGAICVLLCDGAGWHQRGERLIIPDNIVLLPLPPYSPELNSMENIWDYLRQNQLCATVWESYEAIIEACKTAWNWLIADRRPGPHHLNRQPQLGMCQCLGGLVLDSGPKARTPPTPNPQNCHPGPQLAGESRSQLASAI